MWYTFGMETDLLLGVLTVIAVFAVVKLLIFLCKGGTFTQVARDATHLYCQIMIVYPKMRKYTAMYMALMMNSSAARDEMPESLIRKLVKSAQHAEMDWLYVVCLYTEHWFNRVGRTSKYKFGADSQLDAELVKAVSEAACDILERGSTFYEDQLRALPQSVVMSYVIQYDEMDICPPTM